MFKFNLYNVVNTTYIRRTCSSGERDEMGMYVHIIFKFLYKPFFHQQQFKVKLYLNL